MKSLTLNLINVRNSDIKWRIDRYPDGQVQLVLDKFDNKCKVNIFIRLRSSDDIFILMQLSDIMNRRGLECSLCIPYLLTARTDRWFNTETAYSLKIVCDIINSFKLSSAVRILDPHSEVASRLIDPYVEEVSIYKYYDIFKDYNTVIVAPDEGAYDRLLGVYEFDRNLVVKCMKLRDENGKVIGVEVDEKCKKLIKPSSNLIVVDDICDGGGTFLTLSPTLKELEFTSLNLMVTHSIQLNGLEKVSKEYNVVYTTNSFNDWDKYTPHIPNLRVLDIISKLEEDERE